MKHAPMIPPSFSSQSATKDLWESTSGCESEYGKLRRTKQPRLHGNRPNPPRDVQRRERVAVPPRHEPPAPRGRVGGPERQANLAAVRVARDDGAGSRVAVGRDAVHVARGV